MGFKGLEAEFIIIAGLEDVDINNNELMSLIFVGYSRAKMGLTILINDYALDKLKYLEKINIRYVKR